MKGPALLLLVRHGPAGDSAAWTASGKDDAARPLTPDGRRRTARACAGLSGLIAKPALIASSPLLRARQTADLLALSYPEAARSVLPSLSPGGDPEELLASLPAERSAPIALVGHEPALGRLGSLLLSGAPGDWLPLKKAGCALLEFDGAVRPGGGRLLWLLAPKSLRALSRE